VRLGGRGLACRGSKGVWARGSCAAAFPGSMLAALSSPTPLVSAALLGSVAFPWLWSALVFPTIQRPVGLFLFLA
jgi:hypothetical protein